MSFNLYSAFFSHFAVTRKHRSFYFWVPNEYKWKRTERKVKAKRTLSAIWTHSERTVSDLWTVGTNVAEHSEHTVSANSEHFENNEHEMEMVSESTVRTRWTHDERTNIHVWKSRTSLGLYYDTTFTFENGNIVQSIQKFCSKYSFL